MPTGYTDRIKDDISFKEFVLSCARAFGALITMRDDSFDTPIPERFEPSDYHLKEQNKIKEEIEKVSKMDVIDARHEARKDYDREISYAKKRIDEMKGLKEKYQSMIMKVRAWQPPTPDHIGLKEFMIEHIEKSIDWDCDIKYYANQKIRLVSGEKWLSEKMSSLTRDLQYHIDEYIKECERVESRNQWIKGLRNSLEDS